MDKNLLASKSCLGVQNRNPCHSNSLCSIKYSHSRLAVSLAVMIVWYAVPGKSRVDLTRSFTNLRGRNFPAEQISLM